MALQQRVDDYGKPIQPLVDAREEILFDSSFNREMRREIVQAMEAKNQFHCRRGHYVCVTVYYEIHDGIIQGDWKWIGEERHIAAVMPRRSRK